MIRFTSTNASSHCKNTEFCKFMGDMEDIFEHAGEHSQCFHFYCNLCRLYNLSHGKRQKLIGTSIVAGCQKRESFEGS
ncbi:Protein CBG23965 [Caenorhabditis briggsae]|uniref:Protein CBG23965 n=1 Tax=Caenorhabditis briggsae TaxID=6238 RepID=A8WJP2_CAEBR|nr:Protein CBG23965 [Caenorhabditis briggsae]CAP20685.1 Protein CBG23965 [Caenorhabditis briggsae]